VSGDDVAALRAWARIVEADERAGGLAS